jgi:uncharacterized protein YgfB (UPF0149 family)
MAELPTLTDIVRDAQRLTPGVDACELHGALCGWLAGGGENAADWPARVLADPAMSTPERGSALDELRTATAAQLEDHELGFDLLLPDTGVTVGERANALFGWCRGFLGGFGLAAGAAQGLSAEGEEALRDLAKLAQAHTGPDEDMQGDEDALAEIEEYVRVAALLLHGDVALAARHRRGLN